MPVNSFESVTASRGYEEGFPVKIRKSLFNKKFFIALTPLHILMIYRIVVTMLSNVVEVTRLTVVCGTAL